MCQGCSTFEDAQQVMIVIGKVRPSAFAVFMLIINSTLMACCTGKSEGFSLENAAGIGADQAVACRVLPHTDAQQGESMLSNELANHLNRLGTSDHHGIFESSAVQVVVGTAEARREYVDIDLNRTVLHPIDVLDLDRSSGDLRTSAGRG
jgi:hypothetical protein